MRCPASSANTRAIRSPRRIAASLARANRLATAASPELCGDGTSSSTSAVFWRRWSINRAKSRLMYGYTVPEGCRRRGAWTRGAALWVVAGGELEELSAGGFPAGFVARPGGLPAGVAEGARDEIGGELFGRGLVAGGGEIEEEVVLVAAAE